MKTIRKIALGILLFLGFTAILGGGGLISDPSGKRMGFPPELLEKTPFSDYLIPGIILLLAIGFLSLYISFQLLNSKKNYPILVIAQGLILIIWLATQLTLNPDFYYPLLHVTYFLIGILLIALGYRLNLQKNVIAP